jgi:ketosteroid isomerase-like protein
MYQWIAKRQIRQGFAQISAHDFDKLLSVFAPDVHFTFAGQHVMQADYHDLAQVRVWFDLVHRLFPTLKIEAKRIFIAGWPWDMWATVQFHVSDTLPDGNLYDNNGVQMLRIRFGRIVEDHLLEDTKVLDNTLARLAGLEKS